MVTHTHTKNPTQLAASLVNLGASLVAQMLKHLLAMQETQVQSLSQEDPLEKEMATCSSILAWRIPWTVSLASYSSWGCKELDTTDLLTHTHVVNLSILVTYKVEGIWPGGGVNSI